MMKHGPLDHVHRTCLRNRLATLPIGKHLRVHTHVQHVFEHMHLHICDIVWYRVISCDTVEASLDAHCQCGHGTTKI